MGFVTESFGKRIKFLRETIGLTQSELGDKLGISRGAVSYYENFSRTPDIEILDKVKTFFDVPYDFLLGYCDNMNEKYIDASLMFNLSDKACDILENTTVGFTISKVLEHERFFDLSILYSEIASNYSHYKINSAGYISFLITRLLNDIIYDVLNDDLIGSMTDEDKKRVEERKKEIENYIAELEKAREDIKDKEKEINEKMINDPHYREHLEIKDKLINATFPIEVKIHNN